VDTQKEKTRSQSSETLRSPLKPPVAASRAILTELSSSLKEALPKETTMIKCPELAEGCTDLANLV
jgi:hypothetical protein